MTDMVNAARRSEIMARIPSKNSTPEVLVRSIIHRMGFRFRLHCDDLPGTPDIVFRRLRKAVFVNGCFWHGHARCAKAALPKSNVAFWFDKIERNRQRDRRTIAALRRKGWQVLVVWQCSLRNRAAVENRLRRFLG
jgi:DNA mismatch endonuclease (patch repair protein)